MTRGFSYEVKNPSLAKKNMGDLAMLAMLAEQPEFLARRNQNSSRALARGDPEGAKTRFKKSCLWIEFIKPGSRQ